MQPIENGGHVLVREICKLECRFVPPEFRPHDVHDFSIKSSQTAHYDHALCAGLQTQCSVQGFVRLGRCKRPGKMRIEIQLA